MFLLDILCVVLYVLYTRNFKWVYGIIKTLRLDDYTSIPPSNSVKILGCVLDKQLNMNDQITSVSKSVNYHLRNIGRIRKICG